MKLENNVKLLDMAVKQQTLKRSHASALVDKNVTIDTVKRASSETLERGANLKKDVRVETKNAKLIDMVVKHWTLKISQASTLVGNNVTIATMKRDWIETVEREANLKKDVRATIKNANSNEKLD